MFKLKLSIVCSTLLMSFLVSQQAHAKVEVIEFFASWCEPCRKEIQINNRLQSEYAGRVEFKGINEDVAADRAKADAFIASTKPQYPIEYDPSHAIAKSMGADNKTPATVIIGNDGRKEVINGSVTYGELKSKIDALLK